MSLADYQNQLSKLFEQLPAAETVQAMRLLCRTDLYFLCRYGLNRPDFERQWLFDRCREVQASPNDHLDLWSREHYKSTIITYGKTIQDILASHGDDPLPEWAGREITVGIFSHTRPIAKGFLRQIKYELESNKKLQEWFPDVLWDNPRAQAPKWSEDDGITVKRKTNPKEATVEAWGLVDGQPTGKHFVALVYDDIVTRESVTSPEMIAKTTSALELSYNLGTQGGIRRAIGTRYHYNDTYKTVIDRQTFSQRMRLATHDGTMDGDLAIWTREQLFSKRRDMGPYTFACQIMQDPKSDETQGFKREWIRHYTEGNPGQYSNKYILVDAANGKRATNDYTSMWVVGLGVDRNYYVLDMVRDRLNLTQRSAMLIALHRKWKPMAVRYERYGLMADIQHVQAEQARLNYRFDITEVAGQAPKPDRIKRLIPIFEQGRVYFPLSLHKTDYQGTVQNLVDVFIEQEYLPFPVGIHDDMMDALARIEEPDLPLIWPMDMTESMQTEPEHYEDY